MKYTLIINIFITILILSCNNSINKYEKRRIGNDIVEANFNKDGSIEGEAKFYDLSGNIEGKGVFTKGVKNGYWVSYFKNGYIKDSFNYTNNLLNGEAFGYNTKGILLRKSTNYYGLNVGDNSLYQNGKVYEYFFNSLEKKELVNCKYDSSGSCRYFFFNAKPIIKKIFTSIKDSALNLLLYFPHPPDFKTNYEIGLINSEDRKEIFNLNSNRIFIDTIFSISPKGWNYYLSINYKSISNDSTVNVFYQKF